MNWRKTLAGALALAMLICAVGCKKTETAAESTPAPTESVVMPTPTQEPMPATGGTVALPMPSNADVTNPLAVNTEEMLSLFSLVFEGLMSIDATGRITPALAENWTCDEEGRTWTINLRTAARWHSDGAKVTPADVIYSYNKLLELGESSYYAYNASLIENVSTNADGALAITMKRAGYSQLYALNFPIMRSDATGNLPDGTGPYKFTTVSSQIVRLNANEGWWKQRAYIESIVFLARDNNETALASYSAGQLDMVPTSSISAGKFREEGTTNVLDIMTQNAELLLFNHNNATLRDPGVKKAIAYAIDRSEIITNVYMNRARACDVPIAPDSFAYNSGSKVYDYNKAKAIELFAQSGYTDIDGDGKLEVGGLGYRELNFKLLVNDSSDNTRKQAAELIVSQLAEVGVTVELVALPYALGDAQSEYLAALTAGEFDLAMTGVNLSRNLDTLNLVAENGTRNFGRYANAAMTKLAENIFTAGSETDFFDAASEFQTRFVEELPFLTLYFRLNSIIYSTSIQGVAGVREPEIMHGAEKWYINTGE